MGARRGAYIRPSDLVLCCLDGVVGGGRLVGVFGSSGHGFGAGGFGVGELEGLVVVWGFDVRLGRGSWWCLCAVFAQLKDFGSRWVMSFAHGGARIL